jgi:hypothetical protein
MNDPIYKLKWIISPLSKSVDFMDLTITINGPNIHSTLYSNHHLCIPPSSCHPSGILPGMVHGVIFSIFNLFTDTADQTTRITALFRQIQKRGWKTFKLHPLFREAIICARDTLANPPAPPSYIHTLISTMIFHLR